uniref:Uncharacterized protein n=1 Tax=Glossina brevipalpis TaxID=37001 RepID=A0A1A9WQ96_9MUSC
MVNSRHIATNGLINENQKSNASTSRSLIPYKFKVDRGLVDAPVIETNDLVSIVVEFRDVVPVDGNSTLVHFGAVLAVVWSDFVILCYTIYFGDDADNFGGVDLLLHISHSQHLPIISGTIIY